MSLAVGTRIGPYEILAPLGAGGMGEVYRARDAKLNRDVALKILPDAFATDPNRLARFRREAQVLASLNHPNIGHIYGFEDSGATHALVLELVEGPTLADRIKPGPMGLADATPIARQIAEALEVAHEQGIIHRDLKPANIKVRADGTVKVLDFGLAKALGTDPVSAAADVMNSPTVTNQATSIGVILGTAAYMAPEQARGQPVDKRADIWAFGCVLYEMLTGHRPFDGTTVSDVLAAVLRAEIDWRRLPADTPPAVRRLLRRCLERDSKRRLRDIGDARVEMDEAGSVADRDGVLAATPRAAAAVPAWRRTRLWAVAGMVGIALIAALLAWSRLGRVPTPMPGLVELQLLPPANGAFSHSFDTVTFALSPDGTRLAFIATDAGGERCVWMRSMTSIAAKSIAGTESADSVFWSPDGRSIAFFASGTLKRLDLASGAAVPICDVQKTIGLSGTWNPKGHILYASVEGHAIYGVSTAGGTPVAEVTPDPSRGEARVVFPSFLPDGRRFLYLLRMNDGTGWLMLGERGQPARRLMPAESNTAYLDTGALVFARAGTLVGQRFDPVTARVTGEPFAIAEAVRFFLTTGVATFSASRNGTLVYQSQRDRARLAWLDRAGHELRAVGSPGDYLDMRITRSGATALLSRALPATGTFDVWSLDLARGSETRLTLNDARTEFGAVMTPDAQTIIFNAAQGGPPRMIRKQLGTGREEILLPGGEFQITQDVSPDGRILAYAERRESGAFNLWTLPLSGPPTPSVLRRSDFTEVDLRFSPDGRYFTFSSTEGRRQEVYVSSVSGGVETPVSTGGARMARWSRDGREIFYLSTDGRLMAVPVLRTTPALQLGTPVTLFTLGGKPWVSFDVSLDGTSFLALILEISAAEQPLTALLHWSETIRP
jgi:Tol biopolymer transport system component